MADEDPFAALGLAPTMDRAAIKQAYVAAVRSHPPHVDPEAFRRIRAAYEALGDPPTLLRAWLRAPIDVDRELERWNAAFAASVEAACAAQRQHDDRARSVERLLEHCARMRIA